MTSRENQRDDSGDGKSKFSDDDMTKSHIKSSSSGNLLSHHPEKIGKYHLRRVIATGGMGTVFEGVQENPRRSVAIKLSDGSANEEKCPDILNEWRQ